MIDWDSCVLWLDSKYFSESYWWDRSRYRNDGVVYGARWKGDAFYFNGSTNYVECSNHESLKISDTITIEALIYPVPPYQQNFGGIILNVSGQSGGRLLLHNDGTPRAQIFIGGSRQNVDGLLVNNNEWNHLVYVYDGNEEVIYTNGVKGTPYPKTGNIHTGSKDIIIGWGYTDPGYYHFKGKIALLRLYNRALSEEEIKILYNLTYRR